jgi:YfiH family protein
MRHADWLVPDWVAPGVGALMTTRAGGISAGPYQSLNLGTAVGDEPGHVAHNRAVVAQAIAATPVYLKQVHGRRVLRLTQAEAHGDAPLQEADASVTTEPRIACAVQAADCLPVLFAAPGARAVGAAHAGWRGLAGGVLEAALHAVCEAASCAPQEVSTWLGACIGPAQFEVGADVLEAFDATAGAPRFTPRAGLPGKWLADLAGLSRDRLQAAGVRSIAGGRWCTVSEASRFFSYRRDRLTGRMAAFIWIEPR